MNEMEHPDSADPDPQAEGIGGDDGWESVDAADPGFSGNDIEQAYQRALDAMGAVEWPAETESQRDAPVATEQSATPAAPAKSAGSPHDADSAEPQVTPEQVAEAVLFVGGSPITAKRLGSLLGGQNSAETVETLIDDLNHKYVSQNRPYEIRLGEGGYRMVLRGEFEGVRNKVFGAGPREVRLSQDVLEVLALVAYHQPVTQAQIESTGRKNVGNLLRQLLRRELVAIERVEQGVEYHTTPRFLSLFGLGGLDELPKADQLEFR